MDIIDLLIRIQSDYYNVPDKFKFAGQVFTKKGREIVDEDGDSILQSICYDFSNLDDKIEIIEEEKKIQKIKLDSDDCIEYYENGFKKHLNTNKKDKMYVKVLNEIIDYINEMEN